MVFHLITVEVAYALSDKQFLVDLQVESSCTVEQAIVQSGVLHKFSQINLKKNKVGIFSDICSLNKILQKNDRVEIYRNLIVEPMEARRQRARKTKQ
jgi:putative ubiquitin-RnfH superfamily antitoxin RatB of RatAB toxin-antitoxin module